MLVYCQPRHKFQVRIGIQGWLQSHTQVRSKTTHVGQSCHWKVPPSWGFKAGREDPVEQGL